MFIVQADVLETFALQSHYPSLTLQTKSSSNAPSSSSAASNGSRINARAAPASSSTKTTLDMSVQGNKKIILLRDPPAYDGGDSSRGYSSEYAERIQNMYNFILSFQCPVVMILSDVSGRDDFQFAAERCLPQRIRQR